MAFSLPNNILELLRCPICRSRLDIHDQELVCRNGDCRGRFPIKDGRPILINEQNSLFKIADIQQNDEPPAPPRSRLRAALGDMLPHLTNNFRSKHNYARLTGLLLERAVEPRVLVVGGRVSGAGFEVLADAPQIQLIESDASLGPRTQIIFDAHDIPLADDSVDGVVTQAMLSYVADPWRVVDEIHRVLRPGGYVYGEAGFVHRVTEGAYDFTRFTHLGLRRLFRCFDEIDSGAVLGQATVLVWSLHHFLVSFARGNRTRMILSGAGRLLFHWIKYFDHLLLDRPSAFDNALAYYFIGQKNLNSRSDAEIIATYQGQL
ncbi:MAG: methyltransferase domain-containing protein [Proteobacteria bacterium]|nr:methyltransferase domain-containing protein [Pseudomonadota bacterium]MBU1740096.1 methyltransferase domain-containing protein [Pseudomonadota bacterium]